MKIISKSEAAQLGLTRYFTGVACRKGHVAERGVAGGHCLECHKIKAREHKAAHRDEHKERMRQYYQDNKEVLIQRQRERYAKNKDGAKTWWANYSEKNKAAITAWQKQYQAENKEAISKRRRDSYYRNRAKNLQIAKVYRDANKPQKLAQNSKRRAMERQAVPAWFTELDQFIWQEAAHLVILRRDATGIDWAADHMIPLAGKKACGLHVGSNCQVIPAYLNNRKHNKMLLTEPDEWLRHL